MARATLVRFENGRDVMHSSVTRLRKTFEAAGVVFSGNFTVSYEPGKETKAPSAAPPQSPRLSPRSSPRLSPAPSSRRTPKGPR